MKRLYYLQITTISTKFLSKIRFYICQLDRFTSIWNNCYDYNDRNIVITAQIVGNVHKFLLPL